MHPPTGGGWRKEEKMHMLREGGGQMLARENRWKEVPGRGLEKALVTPGRL